MPIKEQEMIQYIFDKWISSGKATYGGSIIQSYEQVGGGYTLDHTDCQKGRELTFPGLVEEQILFGDSNFFESLFANNKTGLGVKSGKQLKQECVLLPPKERVKYLYDLLKDNE